jgi:DinB superfamily
MAMRTFTSHMMAAALATLGFAGPAMGQIKGPVAPALTPEQIALGKSMAAKLDEAAANEQRRLETFKDRPLAAVIQRSLDIYSNYLGLAAEMMPEPGYDFRPTPELRTFGEQINHATSTQYSFCNQTGVPPGVERQTMPRPAPASKAAIVEAFKQSTAYCSRVLAAATESWLMEVVPAVGGPSSGQIRGARAHIFIYNVVHTAEDYGTVTTYLRMQGVLPSSTALDTRAK